MLIIGYLLLLETAKANVSRVTPVHLSPALGLLTDELDK